VVDLIEETVKKGKQSGEVTDLPYTSRAKKVLELSMTEARELHHEYVGTEHVLMGLIRERKGIAAQVLADQGLKEDRAREVIRNLTGGGEPMRVETMRVLDAVVPPAPRPARSLADRPWHEFPVRLRLVMAMAHGCAGELGLEEVAPVHVAIALLEHGHGAGNAALHTLRFDRAAALGALSKAAEEAVSPGIPSDMRVSEGLKNVLRCADDVQAAFGARHAGTQHLLIALLETAPDVAAVFAERGVTAAVLRKEVRQNTG
jgi:ATP-dependent Clp protease ATP-binding subunit ClpA